MRTHGRMVSDDALTRTLDQWLADGPREMPEEVLADALRSVASTSQRRFRGWFLRMTGASSPAVPVGLTVAAVGLVVAVAFGIGQVLPPPGTDATPTPSLSPNPNPPSPNADVVVDHTFSDAGFAISYSNRWTTVVDRPDWVELASVDGRIYIHAGTPDGQLQTCTNQTTSWIECQTLQVTGLQEFEAAIIGSRVQGPHLDGSAVTIGGEDAVRLRHVGQAYPNPRYWIVMHGSRPYLIHFPAVEATSLESIQPILDSWRFLDEDPNLPQGEVLYTNAEDGYEVILPTRWTPAEFLSAPPGTMRFGAAHSDNGPSYFGALTVSMGSPDGTVYDCAPSVCTPIVATTIDELDDAIDNGGAGPNSEAVQTTDVDVALDGEPARLEYVTFTRGLIEAGPQFHHVFAFHDGRPVVLSFDKYAYGLGRVSNDIDWVHRLIEGFRFLDSDSTLTEVGGAGLSFAVPGEWAACARTDVPIGPESGIVYRTVEGCRDVADQPYWVNVPMAPSITIRLGAPGDPPSFCVGEFGCEYDSSGECDGSRSGPFGPACEDTPIRSLSALWSAVRTDDSRQLTDTQQQDVVIDGEQARIVTASRPYLEGRITVDLTWILILRDRPYVVALNAPRGSVPEGWAAAVIASMRLAD